MNLTIFDAFWITLVLNWNFLFKTNLWRENSVNLFPARIGLQRWWTQINRTIYSVAEWWRYSSTQKSRPNYGCDRCGSARRIGSHDKVTWNCVHVSQWRNHHFPKWWLKKFLFNYTKLKNGFSVFVTNQYFQDLVVYDGVSFLPPCYPRGCATEVNRGTLRILTKKLLNFVVGNWKRKITRYKQNMNDYAVVRVTRAPRYRRMWVKQKWSPKPNFWGSIKVDWRRECRFLKIIIVSWRLSCNV